LPLRTISALFLAYFVLYFGGILFANAIIIFHFIQILFLQGYFLRHRNNFA